MLHSELIPASQPGPRRLLVALHGLGDSLEGYRWLPAELGIPGLNYVLVNAPDDYHGGFSWFEIEGDRSGTIRRSWGLLSQLLDQLVADGWPAEQIALLGFSQGCLMTWEAGLRYPRRFAGLVGISGWVHEAERVVGELSPVARDQRFLITHGDHDPLIPIRDAELQVRRLQQAGLNITWQPFRKAHTIAGEAELGVIRRFLEECFAAATTEQPAS